MRGFLPLLGDGDYRPLCTAIPVPSAILKAIFPEFEATLSVLSREELLWEEARICDRILAKNEEQGLFPY